MSIVGTIHFRDLTTELELHKVVVAPPSDTQVSVWAKVIAYPNLTYWTASSIGIVILLPEDLESGDWSEWYFVYGGLNYYLFQYWIIHDQDTHGQYVFIEGRSPSFTTVQIALDDLETFNSDSDAAAGLLAGGGTTQGLSVGDFYIAGPQHDRASYGSITSRLE